MVITQPSQSNTVLFSPVFRCHLNTGPFSNRTTFDHLNTRLVCYSDGYCIINKLLNSNGLLFTYYSLDIVSETETPPITTGKDT